MSSSEEEHSTVDSSRERSQEKVRRGSGIKLIQTIKVKSK